MVGIVVALLTGPTTLPSVVSGDSEDSRFALAAKWEFACRGVVQFCLRGTILDFPGVHGQSCAQARVDIAQITSRYETRLAMIMWWHDTLARSDSSRNTGHDDECAEVPVSRKQVSSEVLPEVHPGTTRSPKELSHHPQFHCSSPFRFVVPGGAALDELDRAGAYVRRQRLVPPEPNHLDTAAR